MKDSLILQDNNYISARRVAEMFGYTSDYVGQLCRAGKLECKMIGRSWFVAERSIINYMSNVSDGLGKEIEEKVEVAVVPVTSSVKLVLAIGLCAVSLFFVFNSIPRKMDLAKNISDSPLTASILSSSESFLTKMFSFFSRSSNVATQEPDYQGIAVAPSTHTISGDEKLKKEIRDSFSDPVIVKPDVDPTTGVITPIFRKANGDDFIYVMVPINPGGN